MCWSSTKLLSLCFYIHRFVSLTLFGKPVLLQILWLTLYNYPLKSFMSIQAFEVLQLQTLFVEEIQKGKTHMLRTETNWAFNIMKLYMNDLLKANANGSSEDSITTRGTVKRLFSESSRSVFKSAGLHSYSPPVNSSDSQQMNGQRGGLGSWGWGGRVLRSMYSDWPANQSIKPSGSSGEQQWEIEVFCLG